MATPLIPVLGYGIGPIPIPALPLASGEINGPGVALGTSLIVVLGLLLLLAVCVHWEVGSVLTRSRRGDT